MAPAPTYEAIYDFETQIESAIVTALTDAGLTAHKQRDAESLETPRIEVQFVTGAAQEEYALLPDGTRRPAHFTGTLGTTLVTNRHVNGRLHPIWQSRIRATLYNFRRTLTAAMTPYLQVWHLQESGTAPSVATDDGHDLSTTTWDLRFAIRHTAWPV